MKHIFIDKKNSRMNVYKNTDTDLLRVYTDDYIFQVCYKAHAVGFAPFDQ